MCCKDLEILSIMCLREGMGYASLCDTLGCEIQLFDVENLPDALFGSSMCCDNALWILVVWLQELRFSPILVKMQCIVGASLSAGYTCLRITCTVYE